MRTVFFVACVGLAVSLLGGPPVASQERPALTNGNPETGPIALSAEGSGVEVRKVLWEKGKESVRD